MKTLSTGEIAKYCDVSLRTVIRWIEKGELKGFKLPGRGNNRVLEEHFIEFLQRYQIPLPPEAAQAQQTILVVDDEVAMTRTIQRALRPEGYQILLANDGFQAGTLLMKERPALMTLDLSMPGVDGFTVLEFVRRQPELADLKILVISALSQTELDRALTMGADKALAKPFQVEVLRSVIEELIGQGQLTPPGLGSQR